jgi:hypothetical protein
MVGVSSRSSQKYLGIGIKISLDFSENHMVLRTSLRTKPQSVVRNVVCCDRYIYLFCNL